MFEVGGCDGSRGILSQIGNGAARKVDRVAGGIGDYLYHVGIGDFARMSSMRFLSVAITTSGSCTRGRMAVSMAAGSISGSSPWILTTISAFFGGGHFGHAVGAGEMVGAGHDDARPETSCDRMNPGIVGGNNRAGQIAGLAGTFVDVLQHGFGGN
jgi:hypothetical protein